MDRGTHYAFFGGRIVVGPDWKSLLMSASLILIPAGERTPHVVCRPLPSPRMSPASPPLPPPPVIFFVFVVPYTCTHVSWAFLPVSILLVVFVFTMLGMTAFRDPGFYPRSPPNSDVEFG